MIPTFYLLGVTGQAINIRTTSGDGFAVSSQGLTGLDGTRWLPLLAISAMGHHLEDRTR